MNIKMPTTALSGQFRMVVSEDAAVERVKHDTGFFDNLITDVGMDRIGVVSSGPTSIETFRSLCGRFVVGGGSATPTFTDTALTAPVAFASTDPVLNSESSSYSRGWYEITVRHQFGQGQAAGNLSEIGIQHTSASGPLWSRALILDGAGNPTTITVLPDDFLTCYYTLRIMIPQQDAVFNIDVDYGEDGVVPTVVTARPIAANITDLRGWHFKTWLGGPNSNWRRFDAIAGGTLVSPESTYTDGVDPGTDGVGVAYVQGSHEKRVSFSVGINDLNGQNWSKINLKSLMGAWQLHFDPPLQKDNTQTMQLTFGYSWARA